MTTSNYIEVVVPCEESQKEIILAILDQEGFDSVMETETGLMAYIVEEDFDPAFIIILAEGQNLQKSNISWGKLENKNWNEEWEKNFDPTVVNDECLIRAPFHAPGDGKYPFELIILPKMSFGTGHHATTSLMIKHQINDLDFKNKKVLDAGCGTAILAIMAEKLGAREIVAYDIDDWCIENAPENVILNDAQKIMVRQGTIKSLALEKDFDVILANINKNVLLDEIHSYYEHLNNKGHLLMSGFYTEDIEDINMMAESLGFEKIATDSQDRWACLLYKK